MGQPLSQTPGALRKRAWRERVTRMGHPLSQTPEAQRASACAVMGCRAWGTLWTRKTPPDHPARVPAAGWGFNRPFGGVCCAARATAMGLTVAENTTVGIHGIMSTTITRVMFGASMWVPRPDPPRALMPIVVIGAEAVHKGHVRRVRPSVIDLSN